MAVCLIHRYRGLALLVRSYRPADVALAKHFDYSTQSDTKKPTASSRFFCAGKKDQPR
jgi:hypothetical protein